MAMKPKTSHERLGSDHQQRHGTYRHLAQRAGDERSRMLLEQLVCIEEDSLEIIHGERERFPAGQPSYLPDRMRNL